VTRPAAKGAAGGGRGTRHQVRIVGGVWRSRLLPVADKPGLRPTPDRVRETLFNWLGQNLTGWRVLDAFAGSGALGFEAASRGAAEAVMIERDDQLASALNALRQRLDAPQVRVLRADALTWMRSATPGHFDLVMLDPPFDAGLEAAALAAAAPLLTKEGCIYLEAPAAWPGPEGRWAAALPGWECRRTLRAGAVHAALLVRALPVDDAGA